MPTYSVKMIVKYEQVAIVETDDALQIEEMARAQVTAPLGALVSVQSIEFAPVEIGQPQAAAIAVGA